MNEKPPFSSFKKPHDQICHILSALNNVKYSDSFFLFNIIIQVRKYRVDVFNILTPCGIYMTQFDPLSSDLFDKYMYFQEVDLA